MMKFELKQDEKVYIKENAIYQKSKLSMISGTLYVTSDRVVFVKESKLFWLVAILLFLICGLIGILLKMGTIGLIVIGIVIPTMLAMFMKQKMSIFQGKNIVDEKQLDSISSIKLEKHGLNRKNIFDTNDGSFVILFKKDGILQEYKSIIESSTGKKVDVLGDILNVQ